MAQWVKDPALSWLCLRSLLWHGFTLWPWISACHGCSPPPQKKEKKKEEYSKVRSPKIREGGAGSDGKRVRCSSIWADLKEWSEGRRLLPGKAWSRQNKLWCEQTWPRNRAGAAWLGWREHVLIGEKMRGTGRPDHGEFYRLLWKNWLSRPVT